MAGYALMSDVRAAIHDFLCVAFLSGPEKAYLQKKIEKIPAADVRENVRGEWLGHSAFDPRPTCSVCKYIRIGNSYEYVRKFVKYCENCGADMRGEKDDQILQRQME